MVWAFGPQEPTNPKGAARSPSAPPPPPPSHIHVWHVFSFSRHRAEGGYRSRLCAITLAMY